MKVFFLSWIAFSLRVMHERPSTRWFVVLSLVMIIVLAVLSKSMISKGKLNIPIALSIVAIIISLTIPIGNNVDAVMLSTYAKAESLYKSRHCQDAKELYWSIYATDYEDCRDKMALCDYRSAEYYIDNIKYENAYKLLLPHLFDNPTDTSPEILNNMRDLVASTMDGVFQENQAKGMLADTQWIIGKWTDNDGNYIYSREREGKYVVGGNIYDCAADKAYFFSFNYGIFELIEKDTGESAAKIFFFPASEDEENDIFAYNISTGKMYFLVRDRDAK